MKKVFLFSMALCIGFAVMAQNHLPKIPSKLAKQSKIERNVTIDNPVMPVGGAQPNPLTAAKNYIGDTLGETHYDLQTNKCVQNRIVKHPDGTISTAWTYSMQDASYTERGTGYNYYDGTTWQPWPTARIENVRVGFPSMTVADGKEVVITHNATGLTMCTRTKGTGVWTTSSIAHSTTHTLTWPRAMGVGLASQTIHLIAIDYSANPTPGPLYYSRSTDAGATWDIQDQILPGTDPVTELLPCGGDSYAMDVKGDTVAIVTGDMTTDIVLVKSVDGGTTWTSQKVWQHQIPLWNANVTGIASGTSDANGDGVPDTLTCSDGRLAVVIGNGGVIHVFTGITKIMKDLSAAANYFSWWPYTDGLVYWNTTMPTIAPGIDFYADTLLNKVGYMVDVNGNDTIDFNTVATGSYPFGEYGFTSLSSMPNAAIGADGALYCTYSSVVENTDFGDGRAFRNIYAIKSTDHGATWSDPINITNDPFSECTFGSLNKAVDTDLHMVFQRSIEPGCSLQPDGNGLPASQDHGEMYLKVNKNLTNGISQISSNNFSIEQNYPNPASSTTNVRVNLKKASSLSLVVSNMLGQNVINLNKGNVNSGTHTFTINCNNLQAGIYFYTVTAGDQSVTKKMIVE
jgi:hypothetical protein